MPYAEKFNTVENIFKAWNTTLNYHVEGEGRICQVLQECYYESQLWCRSFHYRTTKHSSKRYRTDMLARSIL